MLRALARALPHLHLLMVGACDRFACHQPVVTCTCLTLQLVKPTLFCVCVPCQGCCEFVTCVEPETPVRGRSANVPRLEHGMQAPEVSCQGQPATTIHVASHGSN